MKNHQLNSPGADPQFSGKILHLRRLQSSIVYLGKFWLLTAVACLLAAPALRASAVNPTNVWLGAGSGTSWTDSANWDAQGVPVPTSLVILTNSGATGVRGTNGMGAVGTPNITIANDTTIGQLWFVNSNYNNTIPSYHTIGINPGVTLTVSNNAANLYAPNILQVIYSCGTAGFFGTYNNINYTIYGTIQGAGGTLNLNSTNGATSYGAGNLTVGEGSLAISSAADPNMATLDLSGLDNFNAAINHLCVAADGCDAVKYNGLYWYLQRPAGTLYLAKTNNIILAAQGTFPSESPNQGIMVGIIAVNNGDAMLRWGRMFLGLTNSIYCDTGIGLGLRGVPGYMGFNTNNPPGSSTAYFRDRSGTGRQNVWGLGDRTGTLGGNVSVVQGVMDFSLGTVDAMVNALRIGVSGGNSLTAAATSGYLSFGAGIIDANTLQLGCQTLSGGYPAQGTITVSNSAVLKINTSAQIGLITGSPVAGTYSGQIIITNGGTVEFGSSAPVTCSTGNSEIDVANGSSLTVGTVGTPAAPLTTLAVLTNSALTIDFGTSPNPTVAPIQVGTLVTAGTNTINVLGTALLNGTITLIKYGTWNNDGGTLPVINFVDGTNTPGLVGYITNDVANSSIDFVITTGTTSSLVWNGIPNGDWDIGLTTNWQGGQVYSQTYIPGSYVRFDDTAAGTTTVVISSNMSPTIMIVSNSVAYTFNGANNGALSGPGKLVKDGSGLMTLSNPGTNTETGEIDINNGTLQIGGSDDRLPVSGSVVLANTSGAVLDLNNFNQTLASLNGGGTTGGNITLGLGSLTITGNGSYGGVISGAGSLVKQTGGTLTLTNANAYSGGTIVSNGLIVVANTSGSGLGSGTVQVADGSLQLGDGLTANGSISAATVSTITTNATLYLLPQYDYTFTNLVTGLGRLYKKIGAGSATVYITNDNTYAGGTIIGQGRLQISSPQALGSGFISVGNQTVDDTYLALSGGITVTNAIGLSGKTGAIIPPVDHIDNLDSTNTLTGTITLGGATVYAIGSDGGELIVAGDLTNNSTASPTQFYLRGSGNGLFQGAINQGAGTGNPLKVLKYDPGTWTLAGNNTYDGGTFLNGGTLVVNGSIVGTGQVYVGPGTTLAGNGLITGAVTNEGTIFPGVDPALGTLTISNILFLDSGTQVSFDVSPSGNDEIRGMSTVIYGGTLQVNVSGILTGSCVFKLFDAANYTGTFGAINLPDISPQGLGWDTSYLSVDGTLRATNGIVVTPAVTSSGFSGGGFHLSGTGTLVAPYSILATTNLATPISGWLNIGGGTFSNGTFDFVDPTATNFPMRFYMLSTPTP